MAISYNGLWKQLIDHGMKKGDLCAKFGIMSIPTLVVMKNGKIVTKVSGARPKKAILEML